MKPHVLAYQLLGATWWTIKDIIAVLDLSVSESSLRNWLKRCGIMNRTCHPPPTGLLQDLRILYNACIHG